MKPKPNPVINRFMRSRLTRRLRHAGSVVTDCKPECRPGVASTRMVGPRVLRFSHLRPPGRQKRKTSLRRAKAANQKRTTGQATAFLRTHVRNMSDDEMASACGCPLNAL